MDLRPVLAVEPRLDLGAAGDGEGERGVVAHHLERVALLPQELEQSPSVFGEAERILADLFGQCGEQGAARVGAALVAAVRGELDVSEPEAQIDRQIAGTIILARPDPWIRPGAKRNDAGRLICVEASISECQPTVQETHRSFS